MAIRTLLQSHEQRIQEQDRRIKELEGQVARLVKALISVAGSPPEVRPWARTLAWGPLKALAAGPRAVCAPFNLSHFYGLAL